jgi:hypothetical protein
MPGVYGGNNAKVEDVNVGSEKVGSSLKAEKFPQENNCGIKENVRYNTTVNGKEKTESQRKRA